MAPRRLGAYNVCFAENGDTKHHASRPCSHVFTSWVQWDPSERPHPNIGYQPTVRWEADHKQYSEPISGPKSATPTQCHNRTNSPSVAAPYAPHVDFVAKLVKASDCYSSSLFHPIGESTGT